jgi:hypothetical protein
VLLADGQDDNLDCSAALPGAPLWFAAANRWVLQLQRTFECNFH